MQDKALGEPKVPVEEKAEEKHEQKKVEEKIVPEKINSVANPVPVAVKSN